MPISAPTRSPDHPDYDLDCQEAIEPALQGIMVAAAQAGWDAAAVARAVKALAESITRGADMAGEIETPFEDPE